MKFRQHSRRLAYFKAVNDPLLFEFAICLGARMKMSEESLINKRDMSRN